MKKQCNNGNLVGKCVRPLVWSAQPNPAIAPMGESPIAQYSYKLYPEIG